MILYNLTINLDKIDLFCHWIKVLYLRKTDIIIHSIIYICIYTHSIIYVYNRMVRLSGEYLVRFWITLYIYTCKRLQNSLQEVGWGGKHLISIFNIIFTSSNILSYLFFFFKWLSPLFIIWNEDVSLIKQLCLQFSSSRSKDFPNIVINYSDTVMIFL